MTWTRLRAFGELVPSVPWGTDLPEEERTIGDLLHRTATVVHATAEVQYAERLASMLGVHHLPVVSNSGAPLGVLCLCDLWRSRPHAAVAECMSSPPVTIDIDARLSEAAALVREHRYGCLPVLEDGRVVGLLTRGDLRRAGALAEEECPHCATCWTYHHVRASAGNEPPLCLKCRASSHPWIYEADEDEELWGGD